VQDLGRYLEGQGHSMTLQQNRVRPITWFFEILKLFYRNDHHIEMTCWHNNWVTSLKVKVTA